MANLACVGGPYQGRHLNLDHPESGTLPIKKQVGKKLYNGRYVYVPPGGNAYLGYHASYLLWENYNEQS